MLKDHSQPIIALTHYAYLVIVGHRSSWLAMFLQHKVSQCHVMKMAVDSSKSQLCHTKFMKGF